MSWNETVPAVMDSPDESLTGKILATADAVLDLAQLAVQITNKPNPFQIALIGMSAARAAFRVRDVWTSLPSWSRVFGEAPLSSDFNVRKLIEPVLGAPMRVAKSAQGVVREWVVDGARFLRVKGDKTGAGEFYYDSSTWPAIAALMAKTYAATHTEPLYVWSGGFVPELPPAGLVEPEIVPRLLNRIGGFYRSGEKRSYMLTGPPGTGKGTAAFMVARALGVPLVSVDASTLWQSSPGHDIDTTTGGPIGQLAIWQPAVVVVNDIDYVDAEAQRDVLSYLERAHRNVKILFITVNDPTNLCAAAKRPGRIDEIFEVGGVGPRELAALLPTCPQELRDRCLGWPIAYAVELAKRLGEHGSDAFESEFAELESRIRAQTAEPAGEPSE